MSLQKYLQTIKGIDPGKIYVENVRSILKTNRFKARFICELAVQEKLFLRKFGVVCPNGDCKRIIIAFDSIDDIPETITCGICEAEEKECYTWKTSDLEVIEYYQLNKRSNGDK